MVTSQGGGGSPAAADYVALGVTTQTIATYEQGTRTLGVARFVLLCHALDAGPERLLGRALARTRGHHEHTEHGLLVDLAALAESADPHLRRLQRWARLRVGQQPAGHPAVAKLDTAAITALATIAGATPEPLRAALGTVAGEHA